jgi:hypothetical protein
MRPPVIINLIALAMSRRFSIWTIYDRAEETSYCCVAREWIVDSTIMAGQTLLAKDLRALRHAMKRRGLVCLPRSQNDDSAIVESWM